MNEYSLFEFFLEWTHESGGNAEDIRLRLLDENAVHEIAHGFLTRKVVEVHVRCIDEMKQRFAIASENTFLII